MPIPIDPGTGLQDNVKEPILLAGVTGLHNRFKPLYDALTGALGQDNLSSQLIAMLIGPRNPGDMLNVGFFFGGVGNGTLTIKQANGNSFADSEGNRGYVWLRSATNGSIIRGKITADVSISPVGAHWNNGGKGDLADAFLRVWAINDGNSLDDFTPKWGIGYQGGFNYIRNTQDSTTATDINLPEEILTNSGVTNDNSPMSDVGYCIVDFDDTGNVNGEDFWTFKSTYPGESADGLFQPWNPLWLGFASSPTAEQFWTQHGKHVYVRLMRPSINGVSNDTGLYFTLPLRPEKSSTSQYGFHINNGVTTADATYLELSASDSAARAGRTINDSQWANANEKAVWGDFSYEANQP